MTARQTQIRNRVRRRWRGPGAGAAPREQRRLCARATPASRSWRRPTRSSLDADDRLAPGALDAMRAPLDRDPRLGFAYGWMRFFGAWDGTLRFPPYDPYRLLHRHTIGLSALARRELFEDTGGFDPAFEQYEDWELWLNALEHGWRGHRVDAVTLDYRRHPAPQSCGGPAPLSAQLLRPEEKARRPLRACRRACARELRRTRRSARSIAGSGARGRCPRAWRRSPTGSCSARADADGDRALSSAGARPGGARYAQPWGRCAVHSEK